jgi:hypothetical protein
MIRLDHFFGVPGSGFQVPGEITAFVYIA